MKLETDRLQIRYIEETDWKSVKEILKANDWRYQPSMTSQDLYEDDTGYYHKTLCFAKIKEENNG